MHLFKWFCSGHGFSLSPLDTDAQTNALNDNIFTILRQNREGTKNHHRKPMVLFSFGRDVGADGKMQHKESRSAGRCHIFMCLSIVTIEFLFSPTSLFFLHHIFFQYIHCVGDAIYFPKYHHYALSSLISAKCLTTKQFQQPTRGGV